MINALFEQLPILIPALLAGFLVLATHIPLGQEVLRRGIIFLDLAIAQIAAFGVVLAQSLFAASRQHGGEESAWFIQCVAVGTACVGASALYFLRHASAKVQEALIGSLFILAATGSILLLTKDPYASDQLKDILVGQILWVEYQQLSWIAVIYSAVLLLWTFSRKQLGEYGFYPLFAVTITFSTQLVGIYLVFASLIIPALATMYCRFPGRYAFLIGVLGYVLGILLSAVFDLPTGAVIVWSLACVAALFLLLFSIIRKRGWSTV